MPRFNVKIELKETALPIYLQAQNAYTKGPFYCAFVDGKVYKFPLANIWRVTEDYASV